MNNLNKILSSTLILLVLLFCFSLFKNIQYPLLWNDEAETAMFATRIVKFGYPKAHDGKNVVNPFYPPSFHLAVDEKTDAYIYQGWVPFYFASLGAAVAFYIKDIYLKTAVLRIPFAISGALGIFVFLLSVIRIFVNNHSQRIVFSTLFLVFEILSISLILHLREVRYYSLIILLSACIFYVYFRYKVFKTLTFSNYCITLPFLLVLTFNTFFPAYFIFITTFGLYEGTLLLDALIKNKINAKKMLLNRKRFKLIIYPFIPLIISVISTIPFIAFFNVLETTSVSLKLFGFNNTQYIKNLLQILDYFKKFEFLYPALLLRGIVLTLLTCQILVVKKLSLRQTLQISNFLTLFSLVYLLLIARNPIFVFTRYFIVLQPVLIIVTLSDLLISWDYFSSKGKTIKVIYALSLPFLFIFFGKSKVESIKGHVYELFHQYKGPLDYIIPYVKNNYKNPENLVIATNYEETAYMYYLGSKVTIGYVGNNLEKDTKIQPDIINYRPIPGYVDTKIFLHFLQNEKYKVVSFPVYNYPVNNIPEFNFAIPHLFQTKIATNENEKLKIFVREDLMIQDKIN